MYHVLTKSGCRWCSHAKDALSTRSLPYVATECDGIAEARALAGMRWAVDVVQDTFPVIVFEQPGRATVIGGYEQLLDHLEEPMLRANEARFTLYPIQHPDLFDLYKKGVASFWTPEEVSLKQDVDDFKKLTDNERRFVKYVLAFFAGSDGIVQENLAAMFCVETQWAEARQFYSLQIFQEAVHNEQYSLLIDSLVDDAVERHTLFNATQKIAAVSRKADWAKKWITPTRRFAERLLAFVCVEGILFSGSFCAIFWLKQRGLMPGLCLSNEWISRDEGLHYTFGTALYRKLLRRLSEAEAHAIIREAVEAELEFICEAIPCRMIGMHTDLMSEYIRFVADRAAADLGYGKIFHASNPFPFMELLSLSGTVKTNFFERTPSEYQRAGVLANADDREFDLDAAF